MPRSPEVNFYLKPQDKDGKCIIYLQFKYSRNRLVFGFGQKIDPENWNEKKQRVKNTKTITEDGDHLLNELLEDLKKECEKAYKKEKTKGIPTTESLREHLQQFLNYNTTAVEKPVGNTLFGLIERFIKNEIKHKGKRKSDNTIKAYRTSQKMLQAFEADMKTNPKHKGQYKNLRLDFDVITLDFFYRYVDFLEEKNYKQNTLAKYIQTLKVFMGEAVDLGLTSNMEFKHRKFVVDRVDTDAVYLTERELTKLYKHDFSTNKRLEQVRDLFIFGAWVGLRFSDYSNVKPENIVQIENEEGGKEYFIKLITQKTKELVIIPCHPVVLDIFKKYESNRNKLPNSISNQKFNEYLKEVCEIAGFAEKGRLSTEPELELWKCVSSHTARRSFATNYFLQGFPIIDLMKITGHRTEKAFLTYIRHSKLDTAKRLSKHIKTWNEKMMKVA